MKPTLVTGASGFIGWHVARLLGERGHRVRALVRSAHRIPDLDAECVQGDLRDRASLARAVEGCGLVFHVAADYRLWVRDPAEMYRSNVEGTRDLIAAARQSGVERFVYTSTVGAIGIPKGGVGDENQPVALAQMSGPYKRSKFQAEQVALEAARDGFPVVVVNPTAPVGDHDAKPTPTGKIVLDFLKRAMPAYIETGLNLVDVRDTALGHIQACERGIAGERYILGAENLTLGQILGKLAGLTGIPAPTAKLPYAVAYAAGVVTTAWAHVSGKPPLAPLDAVKMARKKMFASHAKASRELGFTPGPVDAALGRAIGWFRETGTCNVRLFVGAVPQEFTGFLKQCADLRRERLPVHWAISGMFQGKPILAIANGAGPKRAYAAVAGAQLEMVCNIGFCGALDPLLRIADIFVASDVNGQSIARPRCALGAAVGSLASMDRVVRSKEEKQVLRARGAVAVEMEAAGALERANVLGIPFYSVRVVSDLAEETLHCDFNRVLRDDGRFDISRLAFEALWNPVNCLPELLRLRKRARLGSERLGEYLAACEF